MGKKIKIYRGVGTYSEEKLADIIKDFSNTKTEFTDSGGGSLLGNGSYFTFSKADAERYAKQNGSHTHVFEFEVDEDLFQKIDTSKYDPEKDGSYFEWFKKQTSDLPKGKIGFIKDADDYTDATVVLTDKKKFQKAIKTAKKSKPITQLEKWQEEMDRLSKKQYRQTNDAVRDVYKDALKDIKAQLAEYVDGYNDLSFAKKLEVERLFDVADDMDRILKGKYDSISEAIQAGVTAQAKNGYYGVWYSLEEANNVELQMGMLNPELIVQTVNNPVAGKTLSGRLYKQRNKLAKAATHEIVDGLFNGRSYAQIAKNLSEYTEADYKKALRIIRTEGGRVRSKTTQIGYQKAEKLGVNLQKRWLATLDRKTRHDHRYLDGQTVGIDDKFTDEKGNTADGPRLFGVASEDINCRCTTIAVVDGIAPELRRDNETGETEAFKNYDDWLANKEKQEGKIPKKAKTKSAKIAPKGYNDGSKNYPKTLANGVSRGEPMAVEKADNHNANPNYMGGKYDVIQKVKEYERMYHAKEVSYQEYVEVYEEYDTARKKNAKYAINCQRCAPTYEMRRRGYDMEAMKAPTLKRMTSQDKYLRPGETQATALERLISEGKKDRLTSKTNHAWLDSEGNIPELQKLKVSKRSDFAEQLDKLVKDDERYTIEWVWSKNSGHIINMERQGGKIVLIDSQIGKVYSLEEFTKEQLPSIRLNSIETLRVDDKTLNPDYLDQIAKEAKHGN